MVLQCPVNAICIYLIFIAHTHLCMYICIRYVCNFDYIIKHVTYIYYIFNHGAFKFNSTSTCWFCRCCNGLDNSCGEGGGGGGGMGRLTVFINDTACEVPAAPVNVKMVFGPNAVLCHPSGYPVPTDEFHNTLQPLQHGAFYYVVSV